MQWLFLIILIPYIYFLIRIYLNLLKITAYHPGNHPEIFVSVIVACRNEERNLLQLLSDISGQTYSPDMFELIIVDDNSSDSTFRIAAGFTKIKNLKVLITTGNGKKKAIKTGVDASAGTFIITTDADCRIGKNWLKTIVSFHVEHKAEMIIGPVKLENSTGFFRRFQELEFLSLQGITAGTAIASDPVMCNGANLAFQKSAYSINADDLHYELASGDDVFLLHNIKSRPGSRIMWIESPEAMITTSVSETLSSFLRQRGRWISKAGSYSDRYTQALAIVTFVTILIQLLLAACELFFPALLLVFAVFFVLKSIPDFLILYNTAGRYNEIKLMKWFVFSQLIYPVYVLAVAIYSLSHRSMDRINSPSLTGI
jgi:cellulose synthase/poly-beta-1,6-N-acetylglucosamine synthase-like glycosyltransferase